MRRTKARVSKTLPLDEWRGLRHEGLWCATLVVFGARFAYGASRGKLPNPCWTHIGFRGASGVALAALLVAALAVMNCAMRLEAALAGVRPVVRALSR